MKLVSQFQQQGECKQKTSFTNDLSPSNVEKKRRNNNVQHDYFLVEERYLQHSEETIGI